MTAKLNELIDQISHLKAQRKHLETQVSEIEGRMKGLERELLETMDATGTTLARSALATASVVEEVVPTVTDWDAFYGWIRENDAFYLLHRRVTSQPYRELLDQGTQIPGVQPYTKRSVSLRSV